MRNYPPLVQTFVEELIFAVLGSIRNSKQIEDKYHGLTRAAKGATTKQLRDLSKTTALYILDNVEDINELSDLDDDSFVREAIMRALPDSD